MAVLEGGASAILAGVAEQSAQGLHTTIKPIPYGALGHYRVAVRVSIIAAQAAGSRLFTLRNAGSNVVTISCLNLRLLQTGAFTAAIEDSIDVYKCTAFSVSDTVSTVTPIVSRKRTSMAAAPGNGEVRNVTVTGVAAGMTGGTLTKDGSPLHQLPKFFQAAVPTTDNPFALSDVFDDVNGTHPVVLAANEGIEIENRVLLGAAAGASLYIDCSYAETTAY